MDQIPLPPPRLRPHFERTGEEWDFFFLPSCHLCHFRRKSASLEGQGALE